MSRRLASPAVRCWAVMKNGTPHRSATTLAENGHTKWLQKPSRVPCGRVAARTDATKRSGVCTTGVAAERMPTNAMVAATTPTAGQRGERGGPALAVQQPGHGDGRRQLARLADEAGGLHHQRHASRREPLGDQPARADEHGGVPRADEDAGAERPADVVGERQHQLAGGHDERAGDEHRARTEAVEQLSGGQLHAGVGGQLDHREQRRAWWRTGRTGRWPRPRPRRAPCGAPRRRSTR